MRWCVQKDHGYQLILTWEYSSKGILILNSKGAQITIDRYQEEPTTNRDLSPSLLLSTMDDPSLWDGISEVIALSETIIVLSKVRRRFSPKGDELISICRSYHVCLLQLKRRKDISLKGTTKDNLILLSTMGWGLHLMRTWYEKGIIRECLYQVDIKTDYPFQENTEYNYDIPQIVSGNR